MSDAAEATAAEAAPENESSARADRAIAILLLTIDQELSARVLRYLGEDTLNQLTRAMHELQETAVGRRAVGSVFRDFVGRLREGGFALGDVGGMMESILVRAFGEQKGADVTKRASNEIIVRKPFAVFESLPPEDLANLLIEEHPQIAAVFMAHLDRVKAGNILRHLPEDRRGDIVHRVATLDRTPPEVVQRVLDVMRQKVKDLGLTTLRSEPKAWIKAAAAILNNMGGGEKAILEEIGETDNAIAAGIRDEMFTFDDLGKLDKKSMQKILTQVDTRVLAMSLKACVQSVEDNVLGNLSKRAADMVAEERDTLGPTPLSEVIEAQTEILTLIRDMMDKGELAVAGGGEELV